MPVDALFRTPIIFFKNFFHRPFVLINMKAKTAIYTLIILAASATTAPAQSLPELLDRLESTEFSEITIDYTLRMPLLADDVVYTLILRPDSVTAIPCGNHPAHSSHISHSQFASLHPDSIADRIRRHSTSPHHAVSCETADSIATVTSVYSVDSIIGSVATYTFRLPSFAPVSAETINNPSTLTEQTITARYTLFK